MNILKAYRLLLCMLFFYRTFLSLSLTGMKMTILKYTPLTTIFFNFLILCLIFQEHQCGIFYKYVLSQLNPKPYQTENVSPRNTNYNVWRKRPWIISVFYKFSLLRGAYKISDKRQLFYCLFLGYQREFWNSSKLTFCYVQQAKLKRMLTSSIFIQSALLLSEMFHCRKEIKIIYMVIMRMNPPVTFSYMKGQFYSRYFISPLHILLSCHFKSEQHFIFPFTATCRIKYLSQIREEKKKKNVECWQRL